MPNFLVYFLKPSFLILPYIICVQPRLWPDCVFRTLMLVYMIRDFATFLKSGPGPVEFRGKAFGPSKLGKLDAV